MAVTNKISTIGKVLHTEVSTNHFKQLTRIVLASMLFENQFYLDGKAHADLITNLIPKVDPTKVAILAKEARAKFKLRHTPLLLVRELARIGKMTSDTLTSVIQRPDEMSTFVSLYWADGKTPISNQVKKGLAASFHKFSEYSLAKWDRSSSKVSIRDILFLSHPKPQTVAQEALFKKLANNQLATPDTWEVALSAGADKKETFLRLMADNKLGALAFLRNLRNMVQSGVSTDTIEAYASTLDVSKVLPFRYIAARKHVDVHLHKMLESMMLRSLASMEKIPGRTALLVDVSGSMFGASISSKSDLERFDAAAALAMLCREVCSSVQIFTFTTKVKAVANPVSGFGLYDQLRKNMPSGGTAVTASINHVMALGKYDRVIVFTDEQDNFSYSAPKALTIGQRGYIVNIAAYKQGVEEFGGWETISGFSEAIIDYIQMVEKDPFAEMV